MLPWHWLRLYRERFTEILANLSALTPQAQKHMRCSQEGLPFQVAAPCSHSPEKARRIRNPSVERTSDQT